MLLTLYVQLKPNALGLWGAFKFLKTTLGNPLVLSVICPYKSFSYNKSDKSLLSGISVNLPFWLGLFLLITYFHFGIVLPLLRMLFPATSVANVSSVGSTPILVLKTFTNSANCLSKSAKAFPKTLP